MNKLALGAIATSHLSVAFTRLANTARDFYEFVDVSGLEHEEAAAYLRAYPGSIREAIRDYHVSGIQAMSSSEMNNVLRALNQGESTVNHPDHYNWHPAGIECQDVIEWFPANIAQAIKYLWRHGRKREAIEDLEKAKQQIDFEIARLKRWPNHETN